MDVAWGSPLTIFPGVGPSRAKALARLGLSCAGDLLAYYPRDYEDRSRVYTIDTAPEGVPVCIRAMICDVPTLSRIRAGLDLVKTRAVDDGGMVGVTFFNQTYIKDALKQGEHYILFGKIERTGGGRSMTNPVFERVGAERFTGRIVPRYRLTAGVSHNIVAGLARRALDSLLPEVPETLPEEIRLRHGLAQAQFSYENIHFPSSFEALELARRRLVFEELFYLSAGLALLKTRRSDSPAPRLAAGTPDAFAALLPFPLTGAQTRVIDEAWRDLASGRAMNRLVQGDVGSGKTAVAAACAYRAVKSGYQCALMAPTEVLAQQHHRSLTELLAPAGISVGLLTGSVKAAERRKTCAALQSGELSFVVGTHALLSDGVTFCRLALVIADEQHRFGVAQRAALLAKGEWAHTMVMSATPIPRTLALIVYGDLDVSVIDELPPGRQPVATYVVDEDKRQRMYGFVRRLCGEGRQAYIVCPMVEENDEREDLKAATAYAEQLRVEVFPELRIGMIHGRLKPREKAAVMAQFAAGELDVLVSTTVIEVGVDNPNAALMIVENAERFGLSQLHQLRGRVGRGEHQSHCVLITAAGNADTRARLKVMAATGDGFRIAEEDLKLRGPGDFFGSRQHGLPDLKIADFAGDMRLLTEARDAAQALLADDPALNKPEHRAVLGRVKALFSEHQDIFN